MFAFQNVPDIRLRLDEVRVRTLPVVAPGAKFDLLVDLLPDADGLNLRLEHRTSLFDPGTIARAAEDLSRVIGSCVDDPSLRLSQLDLLTDAELAAWKAETPAPIEPFRPFVHTFADSVGAEPHAVAVSCGDHRLSRQELWTSATQLADQLRTCGVREGTPVGSYLKRGTGLLVSVLGTWLAGGIHVPLDPRNPLQRTEFILDDSRATVVVTDHHRSEFGDRIVVQLSEILTPTSTAPCPRNVGAPGPTPPAGTDGSAPAYVMYTSGSTGRPKGVVVGHASLVGLLAEMRRLVEPTATDRMVAATTTTFDISLVELLLPMFTGFECVVADGETAADPSRLAALIKERSVTVVQATPSVWRLIIEYLNTPLRVALCGGEALPGDVRDALRHLAQRAYNVYGPTETTIWSSAASLGDGEVTVGRPLAGNRFLVLDRWSRPAPDETVGELFINGPALSHGYLDRTELTAAAFLDLADVGRSYRTGDRVRRRRDGAHVLHGRVDDQVKIRGHRIEPGEVEQAVAALPGVSDCVVVVAEIAGNQALAAVVVPGTQGDTADRAHVDAAVDDWRVQWDAIYVDLDRSAYSGWVNSASGRRYDDDVMTEWADRTVDILEELRFEHVLEIGAGSGIITRRCAGAATSWLATDTSSRAVAQLSSLCGEVGPGLRVMRRAAHEWDGIPDRFDLIVLNSVVQYFPDRDYLDRVIRECLIRLTPDGRLVIGDVRSLPLAAAQYRMLARERHVPLADLAAAERELLIDPAWFRALGRNGDLRVDLRPKHLTNWSEMAAFRFDAVITQPRHDILRAADRGANELVTVCSGLVNQHTAPWLEEPGDIRSPHEILTEARDEGRTAVVRIDPSDGTRLISYVSSCAHSAVDHANRHALTGTHAEPLTNRPRRSTTVEFDRDRAAGLLGQILPPYMVPSVFITVPALPLLPSGKTDRRGATDQAREHLSTFALLPPTDARYDELQAAVQHAWATVLGHRRIGPGDNFFRIGGDSLGAIRVLGAIRQHLNVAIRLPQFVDHPTFQTFSDLVRKMSAQ